MIEILVDKRKNENYGYENVKRLKPLQKTLGTMLGLPALPAPLSLRTSCSPLMTLG